MKSEVECLVEACLRHDEQACQRLYDVYAPKMLGVCLRYAHDRDAAQDMLHDGFIKVFDNLGTLKNPAQLGGWMRRVMVNTALNALRSIRETTSLDDPEVTNIPLVVNYDKYDTERILQAIQRLPEQYRAVFNLYEIEGYSHAEIGEKLGLKENSVRSILSRAKQKLVKDLGERNNY
ncbi:MAG: RNA polymerase sigma factor [Bacteroidales bacterium]|nr:RNA polymerase sigma factor [Bacteroidales bacterium]